MNQNHTTAARVALDVLAAHLAGAEDKGAARLYAIPAEGAPVEIATGDDLYDLLDDFADGITGAPDDFAALGLLTFGWAAPIEEGETEPSTAPSEHDKRRRVRLVAVVDRAARMASEIHFYDTGESTVDEGDARGPLAEKMHEAMTLRTLASA